MDYLPIQPICSDETKKEDSSTSKTSLHYLFFSKVDNSKNFNCNNITEQFKLPIEYTDSCNTLNNHIIEDLELYKSANSPSLYDRLFTEKDKLSTCIANKLINYYSNSKTYLESTQDVITSIELPAHTTTNEKLLETWEIIKNDNNFYERYNYIDIPFFLKWNYNVPFLQYFNCVHISSPFISLLFPFFILLIPFVLIKMNNAKLTFSEYLSFLKVVAQRNSIGNLIINFNNVTIDKKIYLSLTAGFYVFQIYQNLLACLRFKTSFANVHDHINIIKTHAKETLSTIQNHLAISGKHPEYKKFNDTLSQNHIVLTNIYHKLDSIKPFTLSIKKFLNIGSVMKEFYQLFDDETYNNALLFSFGFKGYCDAIKNIQNSIETKAIKKCTYTAEKETKFTSAYYPLVEDQPVKNTYDFSNNIIITGPNASGKTTLLKATMFNIILSQQFGFGYYQDAEIKIYDRLHCYLNIPDTSGRDSLFQAEARRCKEILDIIDTNKDQNHFCIFDELYSGTNPYEAVSGAFAYLKYLSSNYQFSFMLTTHYISLCKKMSNKYRTKNYHMEILESERNNTENESSKSVIFSYTYKLKPGISKIKGGVKVFQDLEYPSVIIDVMKENV